MTAGTGDPAAGRPREATASGDARAVCAGCGCLCDDIRLDGPPFRRDRPNVGTDCGLGRRWFARRMFGEARSARRPAVDGEPSELGEAVGRAAGLLGGALHPRVVGLERLPLGAQRRLVEIADRTGAAIDTGPSPDHLGPVLAVQRDGGPFLTLGEIRERTDCLVLWFARPERTHPRLLERFYPPGRETPGEDASGGGPPAERTLVAVGPDASATGADVAVEVEPGRRLELLWLLRLLVDDPSAPERDRHPLGGEAAELLAGVRAARHGAWVYGGAGGGLEGGDAPSPETRAGRPETGGRPGGDGGAARPGPVEASGLLRLLARLNEDAPWGARPLGGEGNPAGAEAVLGWQSGYPAAVSYRTGRPAYAGTAHAPGRRESGRGHDVVLLAGGHPSSPPRCGGAARIWLDTGAGPRSPGDPGGGTADDPVPGDDDPPSPAVRIPVLPPGASAGETLLRMDGLGVRSPGIPGAGDWDGVPAEEALDALLDEITRREREASTA